MQQIFFGDFTFDFADDLVKTHRGSQRAKTRKKTKPHFHFGAASMAFSSNLNWIPLWSALLTVFVTRVNGIDIYLDWNVSVTNGLIPFLEDQQACLYHLSLQPMLPRLK